MAQLVYKLEVKEPLSLQLKLEEQGSRRILYLDTLKTLSTPKDAPALQLLTKLHLKANGGRGTDTLSFQTITLPLTESIQAIRSMASTERLLFQSKPLRLAAKKEKIYWRGEKLGMLEAFLKEVKLEAVDVVMPGWAILQGEWIELEATVPWKWIELFRKGALLLQGAQLKNFLEEEPPILWKEKIEAPLQVFPQLVLTDMTGCFANLWMNYPGVGRVAFEDLAPHVGGRSRLKADELQWEKDLVEAGFTRKAVGGSRYYCPGEKVRDTIRFLLELGWTCFDGQGRKIMRQESCEIKVGEDFAVRGAIRFQEREGSLKSAMQVARHSGLFLELDSDSVGLLDLKSIPLIEGEWEGETLRVPKMRIGELMRPEIEWEASVRSAVDALQAGRGVEPVLIDERFQGQLLPYQQEGVEWLHFLHKWGFGALLSDEMGLGKTVQVLAFFSQLRTNLPILIVAPTSLLFNWQREIARFWPEAKVYVHSGSARAFRREQVILTSYALLRLDQELFQQFEYEAVALDEAQAIKTATSQAAIAACRLKSRFKISVTGTPVENRPEELWSQFRFFAPDVLGERSDFSRLEPALIRKRIKPFVLRRKKSDVQLQLPEKIEHPVWIEMTEEQQRLYDETLARFKNHRSEKMEEILEVILRLRQICADPRLVGGVLRGGKMEQLLIDIESLVAEGKKVLVFSQFTSVLRLIEAELTEPLYLDGSTPAEERAKLVDRFQNEEKPHVFLLSLKAGGVGLNLTAAESVILFDPWWNEAVERQAIDRAHRIGQRRALLVQRYLTPGSIEEKILTLKAKKTTSAQELLGDETLSWTAEDLLHLLT